MIENVFLLSLVTFTFENIVFNCDDRDNCICGNFYFFDTCKDHILNQTCMGKVENGEFRALWPSPAAAGEIRLTTIAMNQSVPPGTHELNLGEYEGKAIAVQGHYSGSWIYSARMIDEAGPIVKIMVQKVFGQ